MKEIPGFPGYKVTPEGEVYSFRICGPGETQSQEGKPLWGSITRLGRKRVGLKRGKKRINVQVSRLVAEAYVPNPNNYPNVLHKDSNPLNNHYTNLIWGTQSQNMLQCSEEGRLYKGGRKSKNKPKP